MSEDNIRDSIQATAGIVGWADLDPHAKRDGRLLVRSPLEVVEVAAALAGDRADLVRQWLEEGVLHKPDEGLLERVGADPDVTFQMVICQPWVVAQILEH